MGATEDAAPTAVFVIEDRDIDMFSDAEDAAHVIEGYDAQKLDYFGSDGTVYRATVAGREWGPVTLHRTEENRLADLLHLLHSEAKHRNLVLPAGTPEDAEAIWCAILDAQEHQQQSRNRSRSRWWRRGAQ